MSKIIYGLALLSLFGCAVQTANGGEDVDQTTQAQAKKPPKGEPCGGNGGISGGTMDDYGWCCGTAPCSDPKACGTAPVPTCLNCNEPTVDCGNGSIIVRDPRPIDPPPPGPRKP